MMCDYESEIIRQKMTISTLDKIVRDENIEINTRRTVKGDINTR